MIDSHCHLDIAAFDRDRDAVVARAVAAGVTGMLVPAIRPQTWPRVVALAAAYPAIRIALGVHPQIVPELLPGEADGPGVDLAERIAAAAIAAGAAAIGECRLDGATADRPRQEAILRAHVRAARLAGLPLVIHVFRAHDVAPRILREERVDQVGGILHSFSGGPDLVPIYRELGLAFSFAGPISYPGARKPVAAARLVPGNLLLVETDAPDQAASLYRGGRSEPAQLPAVIAALAAARGVEPAVIAAITSANARQILRFPTRAASAPLRGDR